MKLLKLFGVVFFCGLLSPTQGVLSGLSCAVSTGFMQKVLSDNMIGNELLQKHLQTLVVPNIMGDGSMLNSPIIITGLRLERSWQPTLSLTLLPGIGIQLVTTVRLDLSGNRLAGLLSEVIAISVDVTITTNIKCTNFELGAVQVIVDDCFCILGAVKVKLLSGLLSLSVHDIVLSHLTATLPGLLCPVMDIVFNIVNIQLMSTLDVVIPVGSKGTVHYHLAGLPFTSGSSLMMDLDGTVQQMGGSIIPHDSYTSSLPLLDCSLAIGLRQSFLNSMLALLFGIQPHTIPFTMEAVSAAVLRCTSAAPPAAVLWGQPAERCHHIPFSHWGLHDLGGALQSCGAVWVHGLACGQPPLCSPSLQCTTCPATSPLSIRVELVGNPILLLEPNKATVELSVLLQVFVKRPDGSAINLLLLKADLSLDVHLSIAKGSLMLALSLGR
ncbi:hypothetical protein ASZ78_005466 [Callipepla squamata]|uniref:Lipid-binding serum glycoprotein N-terminal domain-containing protein n=1 Tax=Callipepla squamata TaxID=9009 RepID=A0A226NJU2_CALSU|nr:hypothetical protein ASZ78_005466 [Callipepla squamata]